MFALFSLSHFSFFSVFFLHSSLSLSPCPPTRTYSTPGPGLGVPTEPFFHSEGRVTVHGQSGEALGKASPTPCFLGRPQGLGSGRGEGLRGRGLGRWGPGACGEGQIRRARWLQGSEVGAKVRSGSLGGHCVQNRDCSPVTLLGTGTREHGPGAHGLRQV